MGTLTLSLALVDHEDRNQAIIDGTVQPQGIDFIVTALSPNELFRRVAQFTEFDVCEFSFSTFVAMRTRGDDRLVGLPIFPRRAFRHGFIFVNTNSGIREPKDLVGRRVGVSEYQQTASLWIRGILRDEFGVDTDQIDWFEGGLDEAGQAERLPLKLPDRVRIQRLDPTQTLSNMLRDGELDALIGPRRPRSFTPANPHLQRLFPNYRLLEQDYYQRTGYFPIMHLLVMKRDIYEAHPWVAQNMYSAFEEAKRWSDSNFLAIAARTCALPWLLDDIEELDRVMGKDYWPYGIEKNRKNMQKMIDMSYEEGLSPAKIEVDELFPESMREETAVQYV